MSTRVKVGFNPGAPRLHHLHGLVYAAGFFDGEGCVHIAKQAKPESRRGHVFRLTVSICQNHLASLQDFQELTGVEGRIYQVKRSGTTNRDFYSLNYDGQVAGDLLTLLQPYLLRKSDEVKVALEFLNNTELQRHFGPQGCPPEIWRKRAALYRKLRNLK